MIVQFESADPRHDPPEVFDYEMEEVRTETVSGNYEYVYVADVDSLDDVFEASEQHRIIVEESTSVSDYNGADVVVTEYNHYIE